jgi:CRP-like cAMP-binding protein
VSDVVERRAGGDGERNVELEGRQSLQSVHPAIRRGVSRGDDLIASATGPRFGPELLEGPQRSAGVPQLILERLASESRLRPLQPGVDVVVQGTPAESFYAVVSGRVVVHRDGDVRVHLGADDHFGERGLLDKAPRNATVTTEMETVLLEIDGNVLLDSLEAAPTLTPALNRRTSAPGVTAPPDEQQSTPAAR